MQTMFADSTTLMHKIRLCQRSLLRTVGYTHDWRTAFCSPTVTPSLFLATGLRSSISPPRLRFFSPPTSDLQPYLPVVDFFQHSLYFPSSIASDPQTLNVVRSVALPLALPCCSHFHHVVTGLRLSTSPSHRRISPQQSSHSLLLASDPQPYP